MHKGGFSGLLLTDLSKTFDCIDHKVLTAKMHAYGFDIKSLKFTDSYFNQKTKVDYGVAQGSILGPLLFNIIYIYIIYIYIYISNIYI